MLFTTNSCSDDDEVRSITVASTRSVMFYMNKACPAYFVKENGVGEWKISFVSPDFSYEPGYEYTLKVFKVVPDPSLEDAIEYYNVEQILSKVQKTSEGIDERMKWNEKFTTPVPVSEYE